MAIAMALVRRFDKVASPAPITHGEHNVDKLRYGLIGSGQMGRGHIESLAPLDEAECVAIADPHEPSRTEALETLDRDVPAYDDYRKMLDKEKLDAVVVATPNFTHADVVCDALASGVHTLGEKPMATTIEDANRMIQASQASGKIYQVGLECRYMPVFERVRQLLDEGRIGPVRQMWCKEFRGPWAHKVDDWITQEDKTGGALVEKDCHHFDLFNWFADSKPVQAAAFGTCDLVYGKEYFSIEPTVLDNAQAMIQYESGAMATLMLCMYCTGFHDALEFGVIGTDGWLVAEAFSPGDTDKITLTRREGGEQTIINSRLPESVRELSHGGGVTLEHKAFAANIRDGLEPLTNGTTGWWSIAVPLAAQRAIAEQRIVKIEEFGTPPA